MPPPTYASVSDGNEYFAYRQEALEWERATEDQKSRALVSASSDMNRLRWRGKKTDPDQLLQFPRGTGTEIPQPIKEACIELALAYLKQIDLLREVEALPVTSQGYSSARTTYDSSVSREHINSGIISYSAWLLMRPYLAESKSIKLVGL